MRNKSGAQLCLVWEWISKLVNTSNFLICHAEANAEESKNTSLQEVQSPTRQSSKQDKPRPAFSLAEAMITLLLVSIIMAAVAPLMSKRLKLTQTGFSSMGSNVKTIELNYGTSGECEPIEGKDYCEGTFTVPPGVTDLRVTVIGAGGGGGAGASTGEIEWKGAVSGANFEVPEGVNEIEATLVGGGASGGGGNISTLQQLEYKTPGTYPFKFTDYPMLKEQGLFLTMVGGGGGGGGGGYRGGSGGGGAGGGYIANQKIIVPSSTPDTINIIVGGGGYGGGGVQAWCPTPSVCSADIHGDFASRYKVYAPGGGSLYAGGKGGTNTLLRLGTSTGGSGGGGGGASVFFSSLYSIAGGGGGGAGGESEGSKAGLQGEGGQGVVGGNGGWGWGSGAVGCTTAPTEVVGKGGKMAADGLRGWVGPPCNHGPGGGGGGGGGVPQITPTEIANNRYGQNGQNHVNNTIYAATGGNGGQGVLISTENGSQRLGSGGGGGGGGRGVDNTNWNQGTWGDGGQGGGVDAQNGGSGGQASAVNFPVASSYLGTGGGHGGNGGGGYVGLKFIYGLNGAAGGGGAAITPKQKVITTPGETLQIKVAEGLKGGAAGKMNPDGSITQPTPKRSGNTIDNPTSVTSIIRSNKEVIRTGGGITASIASGYHAPYKGIVEGITASAGSGGTDSGRHGAINDGLSTVFQASWLGAETTFGKASNNRPSPYTGIVNPGEIGGDGGITSIDNAGFNYAKLPAGWCKLAKGGTKAKLDGETPTGFGGCGGGGGYAFGKGGDGAPGYARINWNKDLKGTGAGGNSGALIHQYSLKLPVGSRVISYQVGKGGVGGFYDSAIETGIKLSKGAKGGDTIFGLGQTFIISAQGGLGGLSAGFDTSNKLIDGKADGGESICKIGSNNYSKCLFIKGADGGKSVSNGGNGANTPMEYGTGGLGGNTSNTPSGSHSRGFGSGGGGGGLFQQTNTSNQYAKGGNGAHGKIIVQWY